MTHDDERTGIREIVETRRSRRSVLKAFGTGTVGAGLATGMPVWLAAQPLSARDNAVRPFETGDVRLLDGPFRSARQLNAEYMLSLDPDRLLHNFRINAGLEPKAPIYGGWESQEPWVDIRCHGHTLGHWLTAGSMMYAATGDERFRQRVDYLVDELSLCQAASARGLICAFPDDDETLQRAASGREYPGVPWYTLHKIFAGLRDAYSLAGNRKSLEALVRLTDWTWELTAQMTQGQMQRMLDREHGGMNEVLADVFSLTGDERYLELAQRFCHLALLEPLARGEDPLDGLHGNTQIPKVIGFVRLFELTGEEDYLSSARFFWDRVVNHRSFVTGGHGDVEHFFPPSEFPDHLDSAKTNETCGSHNMLRLTRMLFANEPDVRYSDYYERALFNTILASQDPDSGWNTYFQATRPGYVKLYHTPIDSFWCCTGTGMENHAGYGDAIYFHGAGGLYVNQFIASELTWRDTGLTLRQTTRFPDENLIRLEFDGAAPVPFTLRLRKPSWASKPAVSINGQRVAASAGPDGFIGLDREWRPGDSVELRLPMAVNGVELPGEPERIALVYGPIVLAGRLGRAGLFPGADILRNERTSGQILNVPVDVPQLAGSSASIADDVRRVDDGSSLRFETNGIGSPRDVELVPYFRLHHERYNLYWEIRDA